MTELLLKYASWPVAFVLIVLGSVLLLRTPLSEAVRRGGLKIGREGLSIDQATAAAVSTQSEVALISDPLDVDPKTQQRLLQVREAGMSMVIRNQQQRIRDELLTLNLDADKQQAIDILVQHLAIAQLFHAAERMHRLLFGSQIQALKYLNTSNGMTIEEIRAFYDTAKTRYPDLYERYSLETWLGFMKEQNLIMTTDEKFVIAPLGKEFLQWMVVEGISEFKLF